MRERPILFSGPMVRAILDGSKTQTRRVVKPVPHPAVSSIEHLEGAEFRFSASDAIKQRYAHTFPLHRLRCPYGQAGDRLWVRETWGLGSQSHGHAWIDYRAGGSVDAVAQFEEVRRWQERRDVQWYPSIHMPRWACRLTLTITDVRVERLQDISEVDAIAEGVTVPESSGNGPVIWFASLWDDINAKRAPWSSNPWVWVVAFKREGAGP